MFVRGGLWGVNNGDYGSWNLSKANQNDIAFYQTREIRVLVAARSLKHTTVSCSTRDVWMIRAVGSTICALRLTRPRYPFCIHSSTHRPWISGGTYCWIDLSLFGIYCPVSWTAMSIDTANWWVKESGYLNVCDCKPADCGQAFKCGISDLPAGWFRRILWWRKDVVWRTEGLNAYRI